MSVEHGTSSYIPKEHQPPVQSEVVDKKHPKEKTTRGLSRIRQVGPLMAVMLAANLGLVGAAQTPDSREPEVHPLQAPTKPQFWKQVTTDANFPPVYNYQDGIAYQPDPPAPPSLSSVGAVYYGGCTVNTTGWEQTFQIDPSKTYTENLFEKHNSYPGPPAVDIGPYVPVIWLDQNGSSIGNPISDLPEHSATDETTWQYFEHPSINPPLGAVSARLIIGVQPQNPDSCISTGRGVVNYDQVYFADESHPETNLILNPSFETPVLPSVGGIAEMPDLPPTAALSHSSKDTLVTNIEIAIGSATTLAAAAAAGAEINKRRKRRG